MGMSTDNVVQLRWKPKADLGDRLRLLRRSYGRKLGTTITQSAMAQLLEEPEGTYKSWESGNSRPSDLIAFAKNAERTTGVDAAWLLDVAGPDGGPESGPGQEIMPSGWNDESAGRVLAFPRELSAAAA